MIVHPLEHYEIINYRDDPAIMCPYEGCEPVYLVTQVGSTIQEILEWIGEHEAAHEEVDP